MSLRKRRVHQFVQIPSTTIRDKNLSYRARGILAYLLDMPDGWDVKSEVIARDGKEGREAIRTALNELGAHGYYRLERRRMLDGTSRMGTAISEEPVEQWAADYAEYGGKAVPCLEQKDGTYRIKHKDGSLTDDGFPAAPVDGTPTDPDDDPPGGQGPAGDGFSGPGNPGSGSPDSGAPDSGNLGALNIRETQTRETETTSASLRSPADADQPIEGMNEEPVLTDAEAETGRDADGKPLRGRKLDALAQQVAAAWWEWIDAEGHSKPAQSFIACRGIVRAALGNGIPPKQVKTGLAKITVEGRAVSGASLQIAMQATGGTTGLRRGAYDDVATWGDRSTQPEQDAAIDHAAAIRARTQQPTQTGTAG